MTSLRRAGLLAAYLLATPAVASAADPTLESLFERVAPAVVTVRVARKELEVSQDHVRLEAGVGIGSGVVLHADGFIATAGHVVEQATAIEVVFKNGEKAEARLVTYSRSEDLALLKVDKLPEGLKVATLGDSEQLKVGQPVFCIGAPLGLTHSLTAGIVSAIRADPKGLNPRLVVQTDAALNAGNSGGALFNLRGEVVGIAAFIASLSGGSMGLGFAIPSNLVRHRLFEQPIPYLGVSLRYIPKKYSDVFNWPVDGLLVERVEEGSAAEKAGLRGGTVNALVDDTPVRLGGDYIVKVGEFEASKSKEIGVWLTGLKEGAIVQYTVMRAGKVGTIDVVVGAMIPVPSLAKPDKVSPPASKR